MTHIHDQEDAVVIAEDKVLAFTKEVSVDELKGLISRFIVDLTTALRDEGCKLIGHIKGRVKLGDGEQLFFNTTTFNREPSFQGDLKRMILNCDMTINIIVYGISEKDVSRIYERAFCVFCGH